jgi:23S rRNA (uracil1939-C5)-methyltransferase
LQLKIEKLVYGGEGLSRIESESGKRKAIFVPLVLPGEIVDVELVEERPGFARARLERVVEASAARTPPPCPYFGACGGCHLQHAGYEEQLKLKSAILRETVQRIAKIELPAIVVHASPALHYRNRTRMKVQAAAGELKFEVGYYKLASHQLLPVRECPITSPLINRALAALWELAVEVNAPQALAEIEFFANADDTELLLEFLVNRGADAQAMKRFAQALKEKLPEAVGMVMIPRSRGGDSQVAAPELDEPPDGDGSVLLGQASLAYSVGEFAYQVSAGSFFQTNRFQSASLLNHAIGDASGTLAFDLYSGVGLFTLPLAQKFERVISVESAKTSFADLRKNLPRNAKAVQSLTDAYLDRNCAQNPDFVLVDPPRAGLGKRVVDGVLKLNARRLTYVSCDPSTLARDLAGLIAGGMRIVEVQMIDLFPQTFHIETIVSLAR